MTEVMMKIGPYKGRYSYIPSIVYTDDSDLPAQFNHGVSCLHKPSTFSGKLKGNI